MKFPDEFRDQTDELFATKPGSPYGLFKVPGRNANGRRLRIIACDATDTGWEHVSVSLPDSPNKCPSWEEMSIVKALFWSEDEAVFQFHPPKKDHINFHPGCLHLWRHIAGFPLPPPQLVGPKG